MTPDWPWWPLDGKVGNMGTISDPKFAKEAARIASDRKAEDVTVMDLRGISPVTDYFVICTGTSDRQMRAICDEIREYGQRIGLRSIGVAGYDTGQWILIDFVNVVVHIFTPEHREYYDLELLWGDAPRVDWSRSATA